MQQEEIKSPQQNEEDINGDVNEDEDIDYKTQTKQNETTVAQTPKYLNTEIEAIQNEIQEMTKKIEHEKINQRICNERYEKKFVQYCELSGKPVPMTKEEKEKDRIKRIKRAKNHRVADPIQKVRTKESLIEESQYKTMKQMNIHINNLETLTNEINDIELENTAYKLELAELRKQKNTGLNEKQRIIEENEKIKQELNELINNNKAAEKRIKTNELKKSILKMDEQRKSFSKDRDEMELQYHKIIEENIKREREAKKEQSKKRQMQSLISDSKAVFKGANTLELEKQKKLIESEEISDRTPIIELILAKWKFINRYKKHMIDKYAKNCKMVRDIFKKLVDFLGVDNLTDLVTVFQKAEDQIADIEYYNTELLLEIDNMEFTKKTLLNKIEILNEKFTNGYLTKEEYTAIKSERIKQLKQDINDLRQDIVNKRNFFHRIQPCTDEYLIKLNNTYLSDYVIDKCQIDHDLPYNEKNIHDFLSNVQEYYKLIQMFDADVNKKIPKDNQEQINDLRNYMKNKISFYESQRLVTEPFTKRIKNDIKRGDKYDDIINNTTNYILEQVNKPDFGTLNKINKKNLRIKTEGDDRFAKPY